MHSSLSDVSETFRWRRSEVAHALATLGVGVALAAGAAGCSGGSSGGGTAPAGPAAAAGPGPGPGQQGPAQPSAPGPPGGPGQGPPAALGDAELRQAFAREGAVAVTLAPAESAVTSRDEMLGDPGENELADAGSNEAIWAGLMARLVGTAAGSVGGLAGYRALFQAAFPGVALDLLTFAHAARALAAFEAATWARFNSPFDQFLGGDDTALSAAEKRGAALFTARARCLECHSGPLLSDFRHHSLATPQLGPGKGGEPDDRGLALESGDRRDDYEFRTPPLRNVELTGPYFHAGAFARLEDVLAHYRDPAASLRDYQPAAQLPPAYQSLVDTDAVRIQARLGSVDRIVGNGIRLAPAELSDLAAFLRALTDPRARTPVPVPTSVPSGLPVAD